MKYAKILCACALAALAAKASYSADSRQSIQNPLVPMMAMNGRPSDAFLSQWLAGYRKAGLEQFMIYGRSGCEIEYLSDEWFNKCAFLADEAERTGMSVWLYDEFDWPSGTAKKRVMADKPQCALKYLCAEKGADGRYVFEIRTNLTMANLMDSDGVDYFIKLTHEKYFKRFPSHFGKTVKGIFTDEPALSYYGKDAPKNAVKIPYYDGLEADYAALAKSDLRADIAADPLGKKSDWEKNVYKLLGEKFANCYGKKICDWAAAHGIRQTGHLMSESNPEGALRSSGHPLRILSLFELPGMDEIPTSTVMSGLFDKQTGRETRPLEYLTLGTVMYAVDKNGNKGGMCECFALGPCDMPIGIMRREIWQESVFGVDTYFLAISQFDLRVRLSDDPYLTYYMSTYLQSFTPNQSWFYDMGVLGDEAKIAAHFARKTRITEIAVRYTYDKHSPIVPLLQKISQAQLSYKLLLDNEPSDSKIIATALADGTVKEENSGSTFPNVGAFVKWAADKSARKVFVTAPDGGSLNDVFVREYADGSYVVLNYGAERELLLNVFGAKTPLALSKFGVYFYDASGLAKSPAQSVAKISEGAGKSAPKVEIAGVNTLRPSFAKSKTFTFTLKEPLDLRISVRTYGGAPELLVDSKKIKAAAGDPLLQGFGGLYNRSAPIRFEKGTHTVELKNAAVDFPYLPLVVIDGKFAFDSDGELCSYAFDGKGLDGVIGEVSQTQKVKIPADAAKLSVDTGDMAAEVFIDGKSLGVKLWRPFEWVVPENLRGKEAELKIVRKPSFSRVFGREIFRKDDKTCYGQTYRYRPYAVDEKFTPTCGFEFSR